MKRTFIILAAGEGRRMGENKMLMRICGSTPVQLCMRAAEKSCADAIVIAVSPDTEGFVRTLKCSKPLTIVYGGGTRGESVYNALRACDDGLCAIHDGARCRITPALIDKSFREAAQYGNAVCAVPVSDTVRSVNTGECMPRDELMLMQTPQVFRRDEILAAYERIGTDAGTDDCAVYLQNGGKVHYCISDATNQKLTRREDIPFFERAAQERIMRIGLGEDTHRLTEGRELILGGVNIDYPLGLLGHSDADALCHAVCDALFGACALGDIGTHFPDSDAAYKGICSLELLRMTAQKVRDAGFIICNIDATVTAQEPKLAPHIAQMRDNISRAINADVRCVSVKATTPEHTNAEGRLECITVRAVAAVAESL